MATEQGRTETSIYTVEKNEGMVVKYNNQVSLMGMASYIDEVAVLSYELSISGLLKL